MARWLPRKRTILGGTLAMGLIAGIWLYDKLPHMGSGFGLGSGGDGILGKPDVSNVAVQAGDGSTKSESAKAADEHGSKLKRTDAEPLDDVLGSGGDGILGKPDVSNVAVQAGDGSTKSESAKAADEHGSKLKRTDAEPLDDVLTILVEDRHYAVWRKTRKGNGYSPAELDELVQLALAAKPSDDGLRVRILRSESARVTAWQKLQSELVQAGIPAEAIVLTKDLVK